MAVGPFQLRAEFVNRDATMCLHRKGKTDNILIIRVGHTVFIIRLDFRPEILFQTHVRLAESEFRYQLAQISDLFGDILPYEQIAALGDRIVYPARQRIDIPAVRRRKPRRHHASATDLGLDKDRRPAYSGDDPVAPQEIDSYRRRAWRIVRDQGTARGRCDRLSDILVPGRIQIVYSSGHYSHGRKAGIKCSLMGSYIHT